MKLTNRLKVDAFRSKKRVELEITKSVDAAPNPLRYDTALRTGAVEYAGHTLLTLLRILDTNPGDAPLVGLWSLTQMPHQGELYIPTYSKADPRIYFGLTDTSPEELAVSERLVRFKMRAPGEHKIGLRSAVTTGRIGYIYSAGDKHALIIRNFFVNPSGEYADVPWTEALQCAIAIGLCGRRCRMRNALLPAQCAGRDHSRGRHLVRAASRAAIAPQAGVFCHFTLSNRTRPPRPPCSSSPVRRLEVLAKVFCTAFVTFGRMLEPLVCQHVFEGFSSPRPGGRRQDKKRSLPEPFGQRSDSVRPHRLSRQLSCCRLPFSRRSTNCRGVGRSYRS